VLTTVVNKFYRLSVVTTLCWYPSWILVIQLLRIKFLSLSLTIAAVI